MFVGNDITKVRPASAVGAVAIIIVSGTDIPQKVDIEDIAGDLKIPVVAVSEAGTAQLTMGAQATLMFSNSIGAFSPEADLSRHKPSIAWRKQRDLMRLGESPAIASFSSLRVEETKTDSDSDGSPGPHSRLARVLSLSQKKTDVPHQSLSTLRITHIRADSASPIAHVRQHGMSIDESKGILEKNYLRADETGQHHQVWGPTESTPLKCVDGWHAQALVDFEIRESFDILDSPHRDATLNFLFGSEVETAPEQTKQSQQTEQTEQPDPGRQIEQGVLYMQQEEQSISSNMPSNVNNDAHDLQPMVTADVVCVTPGLSVTSVYNEVQAQSMHRGRMPAVALGYVPADKNLDDRDENTDPQIEDAVSVCALLPALTALNSDSDATPHGDVQQRQRAPKTQLKNAATETNSDNPERKSTKNDSAYFGQDPSAMAGYVARLGVSTSSQQTQQEALNVIYAGMLSRMGSPNVAQLRDAIVRFRELCRYKSSNLVKTLLRDLFQTDEVQRALSNALEPCGYPQGSSETTILIDSKMNAAACFRHLAIDPIMGRILATHSRILELLGRSLNQESEDSIRHTVAGCLANLSVQDDENRSLVCACPDVLRGLQLMLEKVGIPDYDKHVETSLAALSNLSMNTQQVTLMLEHVQVESLMEAMRSSSPKCQIRAVRIIRNMVRVRECRERVASTRGILDELNLLAAGSETEARSRAMEALGFLQNKSSATSTIVASPRSGRRQSAPADPSADLTAAVWKLQEVSESTCTDSVKLHVRIFQAQLEGSNVPPDIMHGNGVYE